MRLDEVCQSIKHGSLFVFGLLYGAVLSAVFSGPVYAIYWYSKGMDKIYENPVSAFLYSGLVFLNSGLLLVNIFFPNPVTPIIVGVISLPLGCAILLSAVMGVGYAIYKGAWHARWTFVIMVL